VKRLRVVLACLAALAMAACSPVAHTGWKGRCDITGHHCGGDNGSAPDGGHWRGFYIGMRFDAARDKACALPDQGDVDLLVRRHSCAAKTPGASPEDHLTFHDRALRCWPVGTLQTVYLGFDPRTGKLRNILARCGDIAF
jgi:hypothetical protein